MVLWLVLDADRCAAASNRYVTARPVVCRDRSWTAHLGGKPHDPVVARRLLSDIGIDAAIFDAALDDPTTHDDVRADHQRVIDAGGFGVPTLFIEGQCLFG